jgi:hypothetical protein
MKKNLAFFPIINNFNPTVQCYSKLVGIFAQFIMIFKPEKLQMKFIYSAII